MEGFWFNPVSAPHPVFYTYKGFSSTRRFIIDFAQFLIMRLQNMSTPLYT